MEMPPSAGAGRVCACTPGEVAKRAVAAQTRALEHTRWIRMLRATVRASYRRRVLMGARGCVAKFERRRATGSASRSGGPKDAWRCAGDQPERRNRKRGGGDRNDHLYIHAYRSAEGRRGLRAFEALAAGEIRVSTVVVFEVLAGARSPEQRNRIERGFFQVSGEDGRIEAPGPEDWTTAASVVSQLGTTGKLGLRSGPQSFVHDALIAAWVARRNLTLITANERDYSRIAEVISLRFARPWPGVV